MPIAIGVDIGGSHISSAAVNLETNQIIPGTYFNNAVNSKESKETIFQNWGSVLNQTLEKLNHKKIVGIGFAMPGPFQYKKGIAMFESNDKYEALYQVSVAAELPEYLSRKEVPIRFLNDASAFGIGGTLLKKVEDNRKVVAITLGTGFGAAFLDNQVPIVYDASVPEDGCLWNKAFLDGIADDYFSTRWFLLRHKEISENNKIEGVKEMVSYNDRNTTKIFHEFAQNMSEFMLSYLKKFDADLFMLGGNIAKSHHLFLPEVTRYWKENNIDITVTTVENTEMANIIGASYLFKEGFWDKVKDNLPRL